MAAPRSRKLWRPSTLRWTGGGCNQHELSLKQDSPTLKRSRLRGIENDALRPLVTMAVPYKCGPGV
jgi:hypothetical protein